MSIKVSSLVYERGPALAGWRFLMGAMADNADDQGYCFPGVALLAAKTCASERTVLRRIAAMEAAGWLTVEVRAVHRRGTSARNRVNAYQLNMARLRGEAETARRANVEIVRPTLTDDEALGEDGAPEGVAEFSRCDTVSHRGAVDDVTNGAVSDVDDVTKTTRRCDKPGKCNRKNRQEPRSKDEPRNSPQPPVPGGGALVGLALKANAEVHALVTRIVVAHPRSLDRKTRWSEVNASQRDAVLRAVIDEVAATGCSAIAALDMILARVELQAAESPPDQRRFFKDVEAYFRLHEYRLEPNAIARKEQPRNGNGNKSQARTDGNVEAARRVLERLGAREAATADGRDA